MTAPQNLWAVTCLFNPQGYRQRMNNYRVFRARLGAPLLAVELSFDGRFALGPADADILVRLTGGDVMWQKERLLNIGVSQLPAECDAVAMLDADVVLATPDWPARALRALRDHAVAHLFSRAVLLGPGAAPEPASEPRAIGTRASVVAGLNGGASAEACLADPDITGPDKFTPGFAWAYRRALLERHGLYEACVIGGGDTAMIAAATGHFAAAERRHAMTPAQRQFYRAWAEPCAATVAGRVGVLDGTLYHQWHGTLENRRAGQRHVDLAALGFDPAADLKGEPGRPWRWAGDRPELRTLLADYFAGRREDDHAASGP